MIPAPKSHLFSDISFPPVDKLRFRRTDNVPDKVFDFIESELGKYYRKMFGSVPDLDHGTLMISMFLQLGETGKAESEEYHIGMIPGEIALMAFTVNGLLHGMQTIRQIFRRAAYRDGEFICQTIADRPSYPWRGLHLDVSRHFFDHKFVCRYLDWMAHVKLNKFHWHLSDDQGWRLESKIFPRLHEIGAWRKEADGSIYGGYYTQKQVRFVLDHASRLGIEVIPEIDVPGHAMAILAAYPHLACFPRDFQPLNVWGIYQDILCAGQDEVVAFLKELFTEVAQLFPGRYVHLGGDEAPKERWKSCPHCQKRIRAKNLSGEEALQGWLVKTLAKHLTTLGKTAIGWDEILDGQPGKDPIVMAWRGDGSEAARRAHDNGNRYIVCPYTKLYFDARNNEYETVGTEQIILWGDVLKFRLEDYRFEHKKLLLGAQANVWTEHLANNADLKQKVVSRLHPLAEILWNGEPVDDVWEFYARWCELGFTL